MHHKFSVILCANKVTPFLKPAIESVLNQTFTDFEFLIGLDSQPTGFVEAVEEICRGDPRVKIYSIALPQLQFSLNFLVNFAQGDYLVRMDGDDICMPDRFAALAEAADRTGADIIGSWATLIDTEDKEVGIFEPPTDQRAIERRFLFATTIYHPTVAIRREFMIKMRGYAGGLYSEDYDLWLRSLRAGAKVINLPKHLLRYRVHPGQASGSRLGRAEVAGHQLREFLLVPSFARLFALLAAVGKALLGAGVARNIGSFFIGKSRTGAKMLAKSPK